MRFDKRVTFVEETESRYDPIAGGYIEGESIKTTKPCNQSTMGVDRTNQLFGQIDTEITVVRLQHPYNKRIDYVYLNDDETQQYEIKRQSNYRKGVFYLEGVSHG